jgi:hypothetical protein
MGKKLVVGPISKGLKTDILPFNIDNDSFPTLTNAYQWRSRAKRKRGTSLLGRLKRYFVSTNSSYSATSTIALVGGAANILTGFGLQASGNIVPGSVTIIDTTASQTYTDSNGVLTGSSGGTGTIIYSTGAIMITGGGINTISATFFYYPGLPVMGLEDFAINATQFPGTIAFDTKYSYNWLTVNPYPNYDVSFYKNPTSGTYSGYVAKTNETSTTWNGANYQQFFTVNYQGALFVTNGIDVPFTGSKIGMQFQPTTVRTTVSAPTVVTFTIGANPLVIGDFVFTYEFLGTGNQTLNGLTGYVTAIGSGTITVTFPNANITSGTYMGGILQFLTNRSNTSVDCIRYYDGDPTNGSPITPALTGSKGWVNFMPPLSQELYSIADLPKEQYYLVGARIIVTYKDRLLFFGPVVQTSVPNAKPIYLQDTVIYSQNGTPYYTCTFQGSALTPTTSLSLLTPDNQGSNTSAWWEDQTGFGGFQTIGIDQPILTVAPNQDVLIIGINNAQAKLVYTGNDVVPFNFYIINSELGSGSTFATIIMDQGVITRGSRGYITTSQESARRIDVDILDQAFELDLTNNGNERFCAQRDFINEWIYFTYNPDIDMQNINIFPSQTLLYNYRDNSWAIFSESYTTYGSFRKQTGFTWQTVGLIFSSWNAWNEPWNAGSSQLLQPLVIAGNQQGFVLIREDDITSEATSLTIQNISGNTITCLNHNLYTNQYIIISGVIGSSGAFVNGKTFPITVVDVNTFTIPIITSGTYFGGGLITLIYIPLIQTKQFPLAWDMGRKTRLGVQQYLLTKTTNSQITLLIYLSQNSATAYNAGAIVPNPASINNSLIYSSVLFTCPESTNIGLTPFNSNLQTPTAQQQAQIWHRKNTSLIGDTVQLGFTMTPDQITVLISSGTAFAITEANQTYPCVLQCTGNFAAGQLISISGVVGMTQLNGNTYQVITSDTSTVTINVDSTSFTMYSGGGTATPVANPNAFAEIELHGFILDVSPSQLLV